MTEPDAELYAAPEDLIAELHRASEGASFKAPWQARIFGLVVALHDADDDFDWMAFQKRLIEEVALTTDGVRDEPAADSGELTSSTELDALVERTYDEQWLAAFERLLVEEGYLDPTEIQSRAKEFADGDRTAEEFIEGERRH